MQSQLMQNTLILEHSPKVQNFYTLARTQCTIRILLLKKAKALTKYGKNARTLEIDGRKRDQKNQRSGHARVDLPCNTRKPTRGMGNRRAKGYSVWGWEKACAGRETLPLLRSSMVSVLYWPCAGDTRFCYRSGFTDSNGNYRILKQFMPEIAALNWSGSGQSVHVHAPGVGGQSYCNERQFQRGSQLCSVEMVNKIQHPQKQNRWAANKHIAVYI